MAEIKDDKYYIEMIVSDLQFIIDNIWRKDQKEIESY